jgi:ADP-dependent phosphofructokinase/glucokinase
MSLKLKVATGLYTNWDSLVKVDDALLRWVKNSKKSKPKGTILDSKAEVIYVLNEALKEGGREFLISEKLYVKLNSLFSEREKRLGGNGYHMGKALYELGQVPLVSYPCRPPKLMKASPNFKIACKDGFRSPTNAIRDEDPEYDHIVFEFEENQSKGINVTSRLILSWDLMSFEGKFDHDFLKYASNSEFTDVLTLGYAHLLLPKFKKRTDEVIDYLRSSRRPKVHLEFGQGSEESMRYAMNKFADYNCADSWGLNEKECVNYLNAKSEKLEDLKEAAVDAIKKYGIERICVHAPFFSFSISRYGAKKEVKALIEGGLVASAFTLGKDIKRNLKYAKKLPRYKIKKRTENIDNYRFCLVPNLINMKPKILTGLGDVFAAAQAVEALS